MCADVFQNMVRAGFDNHKGQHTMVLLGPDGCLLGKKVEVVNTKAGFEQARRLIDDAVLKTGAQGVSIGVEATGFYHLNLVSELVPYYPDVRIYNPKLLGVHRRAVREKKNDHKDALKIGWALREDLKGSMPYGNLPLMEIQELCRFRSRMLKDRSNLMKRFRRNLHLLCPGYDTVVRAVFSRNSTRLLERYPSAEAMRGISIPELKAATQPNGKYGLRDCTIRDLKELVESIPDCPYYREAIIMEQGMILKRILQLDRQVKKVMDNATKRWIALAINPAYFQIVGLKLEHAIPFYAETGDLRRFPSCDKFVGFLGLDPFTKRSDDDVKYGRLTKMGSRYAREALGNAVRSMHRTNPVIRATWEKAESHGRKYRERIVICMRKLARIMWGIENHPRQNIN
jgi:transposase